MPLKPKSPLMRLLPNWCCPNANMPLNSSTMTMKERLIEVGVIRFGFGGGYFLTNDLITS